MATRHARGLLSVVAAILLVGCRDSTGPIVYNRFVAGTYTLASSSDPALVGGTVTLTSAGGAEQRLEYSVPAGGVFQVAAVGTFRARADGVVELTLHDPARTPRVDWYPRAQFRSGQLEFRFGSPVDGPDIVQVFVRQ